MHVSSLVRVVKLFLLGLVVTELPSAQCSPEWSALGAGLNGPVRALLSLPNGHLVVGGDFSQAGGVDALSIACWDGVQWSAMGTGLNGAVKALVLMPTGDIVAAGGFVDRSAGVDRVARWDGTAWQPLGPLDGDGDVLALTCSPDGDLLAGGDFSVGGTDHIARWDGSAWFSVGGANAPVSSLTTLQDGDVVAGGSFNMIGGVSARRIACWDGASWFAMGPGLSDRALDLEQLSNGDLIAVGNFGYIGPPGGTEARGMARWNGTLWSPLGTLLAGGVPGPARGEAVAALPNGELIVGGFFDAVGTVSVSNIAKLDGSGWSALGAGTTNTVFALVEGPHGEIFAGGDFNDAGEVSASRIARWGSCAVPTPALGAFGLPCAAALLAGFGVWILRRKT